MSIMNTTRKLLHKNCYIAYLLALMSVLYAVFSLGGYTVAYADGTPGGNIADPVVRAVDIANPAIVRIITAIPAKLTVHFSATDNVTFPQSGNPYPLEFSGSGAFISGHGDILTADHVVNPPQDALLSQYLDQTAAQDVATYINQHGTQQVTSDQVTQALQSKQIASDPQYGTPISDAFLSTAYTGTLTATTFSALPKGIYARVDSIEKQSPVDQKDVAVVHVPMNDTPNIVIGDSTAVQQQDELTIIGFPGNGDVGNNPSSVLSSSINKVIVSSLKTKDNGAPVIQVGGNVEHGDSGGPALNSGGKIVGVVSFGTSDPNSPGSTSFLQASSSAEELVQSLNLDTTPGAFQKTWGQAFTDYASTSAGHWHKAASEFSQLQSSYPNFKAVTPYLNYAQDQAKNEQVPNAPISIGSISSVSALAWTIGAVTFIALLVLVIVALGFGRKGKKSVVAPIHGGQGYPIQPGQVSPMYGQMVQPQQSNNAYGSNTPPAPQVYGNGLSAFGAPQPTSTYSVPPYPGQAPIVQPPPIVPSEEKTVIGSVPQPQGQTPVQPPPIVPLEERTVIGSVPQPQGQASDNSAVLRPWPCGHLNRSNARFCSVCGEPTPPPPASSTFIRHIEQ